MRSLPGTINGLQVKQACLTHQGKLPYRQAVNNLELHPRTKRYVQICRRSLWLESLLWRGACCGEGACSRWVAKQPPIRSMHSFRKTWAAGFGAASHPSGSKLPRHSKRPRHIRCSPEIQPFTACDWAFARILSAITVISSYSSCGFFCFNAQAMRPCSWGRIMNCPCATCW